MILYGWYGCRIFCDFWNGIFREIGIDHWHPCWCTCLQCNATQWREEWIWFFFCWVWSIQSIKVSSKSSFSGIITSSVHVFMLSLWLWQLHISSEMYNVLSQGILNSDYCTIMHFFSFFFFLNEIVINIAVFSLNLSHGKNYLLSAVE